MFCAAALGALLEGRHPPGSRVQDDSLGIDHYKALSFCASSRLLVLVTLMSERRRDPAFSLSR